VNHVIELEAKNLLLQKIDAAAGGFMIFADMPFGLKCV
jgi:hypothetical protein